MCRFNSKPYPTYKETLYHLRPQLFLYKTLFRQRSLLESLLLYAENIFISV